MTDATRQSAAPLWARLAGALPDDLGGRRVLLVGGAGAADLDLTEAAGVERWDPAGSAPPPPGPFDLFLSAAAIESTPHPANLLTALCGLASPGAVLLLHSRVLTDPEQSAYARFVGADAGIGSAEWLPGRLAFRWTVETNGFDVDRWIDAGTSEPRGEGDAFLVATRNARKPALISATPDPDDDETRRGGQA